MSHRTNSQTAASRFTIAMLVEACILSAIGLLWLVPLANSLHVNTGHDFKLLYAAAVLVRHHQNPYDPATFLNAALAAGLQRTYLVNGHSGLLNQPFVYPPLFAWLIIPFTLLAPTAALLSWRIVSLVCVFGGSLGLIESWARTARFPIFTDRWARLLVALLVTAAPLTAYGVYWGNPVVLVFAAMGLWVWLLVQHNRTADLLAGTVMSVTLLKPQLALPLALIAAFVLVRGPDRWPRRARCALAFGGTTVALLAIDLLATGPALLLAWPRSVLSLSQQIFAQPDMPSVIGAFQPELADSPSWIQSSVLYGIMLVGLVMSLLLYRRLRDDWRPLALLGLLTVIWCCAAPYAHANDALLFVPGALVAIMVCGDSLNTLWDAWRSGVLFASRRTVAQAAAQLVVALLALVALWFGGTIRYLPVQWQMQPLVLAPFLLLVCFAIAGPRLVQRAGRPPSEWSAAAALVAMSGGEHDGRQGQVE